MKFFIITLVVFISSIACKDEVVQSSKTLDPIPEVTEPTVPTDGDPTEGDPTVVDPDTLVTTPTTPTTTGTSAGFDSLIAGIETAKGASRFDYRESCEDDGNDATDNNCEISFIYNSDEENKLTETVKFSERELIVARLQESLTGFQFDPKPGTEEPAPVTAEAEPLPGTVPSAPPIAEIPGTPSAEANPGNLPEVALNEINRILTNSISNPSYSSSCPTGAAIGSQACLLQINGTNIPVGPIGKGVADVLLRAFTSSTSE